MNKPSTEVKSHVIVFFDGSHMFIIQKQYDVIMHQSDGQIDGLEIDGGYVKFNSIAKILPLGVFYQQYPDAKPEPQMRPFKFDAVKVANSKNAITSLLRGYEAAKSEMHGQELWDAIKGQDKIYKSILKKLRHV